MSAVLIASRRIAEREVETAWAKYRALIRAEIGDRSLLRDDAHNRAREQARIEFQRMFDEWVRN
jgi:uncharacterized protein YifE (UPF0438 family)